MSITGKVVCRGDPSIAIGVIKRAIKPIVEQELTKGGHRAMAKTLPITPIDTGNLRSSWYVTNARLVGRDIRMEIGFRAEYAWHVHNDPVAWHEAPTQAFFLDEGVRRSGIENTIPERINKRLRPSFKVARRLTYAAQRKPTP